MADLVKLSEAVNLAFHAMIDLAQRPDEEVPLKEIAHRLQASEAHLSKVLQRLRKAGLVSSCRGPAGGYQLARPPAAITFEAIFETIEGPIEPHFCLFGTPVCQNPDCGLGRFVGLLNQKMKDFLAGLTLADLPLTAGKMRKMKLDAA